MEEPVIEQPQQEVQPEEAQASETSRSEDKRKLLAFLIGVAAWAVPGLGNLFTSRGEDAFAALGYFADLGSGSFYWFARLAETAGPDTSHSAGDYGTRFLATAGVLNLLAALHAYEAARGRKA